MSFQVYIDGQEGTTGLQLQEKLARHGGVSLIRIAPEKRKDTAERKKLMNQADVVFLCLPDAAAKEAVSLVENPNTCIIDASTAHRTIEGWVYGFPELSKEHRKQIQQAKRIANPGCHATGFIAAAYPLIAKGIASPEYPFTAYSLTGYSGGGKGMIAEYEAKERSMQYDSPRQYGLSQMHKHLPEIQKVVGLTEAPVFMPIVGDFYSGMATCLPLHTRLLEKKISKAELTEVLQEYYAGHPLISVEAKEDGFLAANENSNTNKLRLYIAGNDARITLVSVFDNLGKGASGAAVQNMNLALGLPETQGLL